MIRHVLTAFALLSAAGLAAPGVGHAQTFKVEKFDIKGEGGTDYVAVEAATGRVFVSRANHMMVIEGATGKVLGDILNTPGVHGAGLVTKVKGEDNETLYQITTAGITALKDYIKENGELPKPRDKTLSTNIRFKK